MADNLVKFPREYIPPPLKIQDPTDEGINNTHHEETFQYDDGSYVILVLPKDKEFTIERMVFMAERVKRTMFDCAEYSFDEEDAAPVDDPNNAS